MRSKEEILNAIRTEADKNGGKVPGRRTFERDTGITQGEWLRHWPRWSDAVVEAGLAANRSREKISTESILSGVAKAVRHYQRVPTQPELRHFRRDNPSLPDDSTIRRSFPSKADMVAALRDYCESEPEHADLLAFLPDEPTSSVGPDQSSDLQKGWVYLAVMQIGRERTYKIGKSTAVNRRMGEIKLEMPVRRS